jgi:catechol 2,3-dioxygenase-like lactoylglutathione lyase family enzyme
MLSDNPAMANIAVKDIDVAREFYENTLGLTKLREYPSGRTMYKTGNTALFVYPSKFAGTNKADYVAWEVGKDFSDVVAKLRSDKIMFEHYPDIPGIRIVDDVHIMGESKMGVVWIRDPDGNLINISGNI